jgi:hypothetical protein
MRNPTGLYQNRCQWNQRLTLPASIMIILALHYAGQGASLGTNAGLGIPVTAGHLPQSAGDLRALSSS